MALRTVAGVFDFETGLRLVKFRGEAMQQAAEAPPGGPTLPEGSSCVWQIYMHVHKYRYSNIVYTNIYIYIHYVYNYIYICKYIVLCAMQVPCLVGYDLPS